MRLEQNLRIFFCGLELVAQALKRCYQSRLHYPMHNYITRLLSPSLLRPQLLPPSSQANCLRRFCVIILNWYSLALAPLRAWAMFCKSPRNRLSRPATWSKWVIFGGLQKEVQRLIVWGKIRFQRSLICWRSSDCLNLFFYWRQRLRIDLEPLLLSLGKRNLRRPFAMLVGLRLIL